MTPTPPNQTWKPPEQYYRELASVIVSASVLITDATDRVLLVKPNYRKDEWALPGGIAEDGETPRACAQREAREEVGLDLALGALLVMDWAPAHKHRLRPIMNFVYDGGTADPRQIQLQTTELEAFAFVDWEAAEARFPAHTAHRVPAARLARKDGRTTDLTQTR